MQKKISKKINNLRLALELVSMGLADSVDNPECYAIVKEGNKKIPDPEQAGTFLRELLSQTGRERY